MDILHVRNILRKKAKLKATTTIVFSVHKTGKRQYFTCSSHAPLVGNAGNILTSIGTLAWIFTA
jgi:hypothetical protein